MKPYMYCSHRNIIMVLIKKLAKCRQKEVGGCVKYNELLFGLTRYD